MPGRDGTGPMGAGPMTGGSFGNCAGRFMRRMFQGRGMGRAGGGGLDTQGYRAEEQTLMRQNELLRSELVAMKKRLDEMEKRAANSG